MARPLSDGGALHVAELHSAATPARERIRDTAAQDRELDTRPRRRRRLGLAGAGLVLALLVAVLGYPALQRYAGSQLAVPLDRLRLASVVRADFIRDVAVDGTVVAAISPTLFAPAEGTVTFHVVAGDVVEQGQSLASLDSPVLSNRLEQEKATLQSLGIDLERQRIEMKTRELRNQQTVDLAHVNIKTAERELRRAERSHEQQVISLQDYEKARDDLDKARLEFAHAGQNARLEIESMAFELETMGLERDRQRLLVEDLERQVAALAISSPVSGLVGSLAVDQKATVQRNAPLITVVDLSAFEIEVQVPENYGDDLLAGLDAEVTFGGRQHAGLVTSISPEVRDNQVTGRVRFVGSPPDGLRQNQRVSVRIVLESKPDTFKVQRGPFLDSGAGRVAYVVSDGVATRRPVQVGSTSIREVEILEGLAEGDTIVISDLSQFEGADQVLLTE